MALPYPSKTFSALGIPTTAQWNELNANDQALAAGTGLNQGAVPAAALATSAITLGYAQITANVSTTSTSMTQATGLTVTVTIPAGGRKVRITVYTASLNSSSGVPVMSIWDGAVGSGTQLNQANGVANNGPFAKCEAVVTPSAGSKTYNVGYNITAGTVTINANATFPAFILVEAI